jgi:Na+-translocating ferredoxin:NAD+ oxidoreductase RnfE subunit
MDTRALRRQFLRGLFTGLKVVWPVLSTVLALIVGLGIVVGLREGWSLQESVYFSFVTGLTIGYGDLAPKSLIGRVLAVLIGVCGVIVTGLIAAVAVRAITAVYETRDE